MARGPTKIARATHVFFMFHFVFIYFCFIPFDCSFDFLLSSLLPCSHWFEMSLRLLQKMYKLDIVLNKGSTIYCHGWNLYLLKYVIVRVKPKALITLKKLKQAILMCNVSEAYLNIRNE